MTKNLPVKGVSRGHAHRGIAGLFTRLHHKLHTGMKAFDTLRHDGSLAGWQAIFEIEVICVFRNHGARPFWPARRGPPENQTDLGNEERDRKSTRLNSSHVRISY